MENCHAVAMFQARNVATVSRFYAVLCILPVRFFSRPQIFPPGKDLATSNDDSVWHSQAAFCTWHWNAVAVEPSSLQHMTGNLSVGAPVLQSCACCFFSSLLCLSRCAVTPALAWHNLKRQCADDSLRRQ